MFHRMMLFAVVMVFSDVVMMRLTLEPTTWPLLDWPLPLLCSLSFASTIVISCWPGVSEFHFKCIQRSRIHGSLTRLARMVSVDFAIICDSICFCDVPGDVLAAPASALWWLEITSIPASLAD